MMHGAYNVKPKYCLTTIELRNAGIFLCKIKFNLAKHTKKMVQVVDEESEGQV